MIPPALSTASLSGGATPAEVYQASQSSDGSMFRDGYQARVNGAPVSNAPSEVEVGDSGHHFWISGWTTADSGLPENIASAYDSAAPIDAVSNAYIAELEPGQQNIVLLG